MPGLWVVDFPDFLIGIHKRPARLTPSAIGIETYGTLPTENGSELGSMSFTSGGALSMTKSPEPPETAGVPLIRPSRKTARSRKAETLISWVREMLTLRLLRIFPSICMAIKECPPNSKKSSVAEMSGNPSNSVQIEASSNSVAPSGSSKSPVRARPAAMSSELGSGRALRSTLPLLVCGNFAIPTKTDGTMYSGRDWRSSSRK
mmetsp:Transcript_29895/g.41374  ORF Transcript_29895/g.41374 Transcript_29895/m.41374 type:complete len:204 (-) Transcript_29895:3854-4465(-)